MRTLINMLVVIVAICTASAVAATDASEPLRRATDGQIERLIDAVARDTSAFRKALPADLKRGIVRGPKGEVDVEHYLDDLAEDIKKLQQRFKPDYSASADVMDLLNRAAPLHNFMRARPEMKGANEWDVVARDLVALAADYGVTFPLVPDAVVRRMGDREIKLAAESVVEAVGKTQKALKSAVGKNAALQAPAAAIAVNLDELAKAAKDLRSRINSGKPATAEARIIVARADAISSALTERAAEFGAVRMQWDAAAGSTATIAQAFGLTIAAATAEAR